MVHEYGLACPRCRTADVHANMLGDGESQTRSPNCPNCRGDGWIFRDGTVVRGLATSIRQQNKYLDVGMAQPGDMQFSLAPELGRRVSQGDKFTATWTQPLNEGQTVVRGAATMGENLRLKNNVDTDEDRLWYEPGESVWCEDVHGTVYKADGDFQLGPGRIIKWVGARPAVGVKYVIKYTAYLEWLVFAPPQERVDRDNKDLGPLVFLRKRHVAFVNDSPFITAADRVPLRSRVAC